MTKNELIDIYDALGKRIGTKPRHLVHRDGDWHKTFHCWVICRGSDGSGYIVMQRRSDKKNSWPGRADVTAAGHYLAGETRQDGVRELKEEIGVDIAFQSLIPLGTRVCIEDFSSGVLNHEFQDVFFHIGTDNLDKYALQGDELSGIMRSSINDCLQLFSGGLDTIKCEGVNLVSSDGQVKRESTVYTLNRDSFIPSLDQYNYKVMILADRALRGESHLLI